MFSTPEKTVKLKIAHRLQFKSLLGCEVGGDFTSFPGLLSRPCLSWPAVVTRCGQGSGRSTGSVWGNWDPCSGAEAGEPRVRAQRAGGDPEVSLAGSHWVLGACVPGTQPWNTCLLAAWILQCSCGHTQRSTCKHTAIHIDTHTRILTHTHIDINIDMQIYTHRYTYTHSDHTDRHVCIHAYTDTHACVHTYIPMPTCACIWMPIQTMKTYTCINQLAWVQPWFTEACRELLALCRLRSHLQLDRMTAHFNEKMPGHCDPGLCIWGTLET